MRRLLPWQPVILAVVAGCAKVFGFEDLTESEGRSDAGPERDGSPDAANAPVDAWHVSPSGDDAADGSERTPLRSLTEAVRRANAALEQAPEARQTITMCAGDYAEPGVVVLGPITVRGNYDCATWKQRVPRSDGAGVSDISLTHVTESGPTDILLSFSGDARGTPELDALSVTTTQVGVSVFLGDGAAARNLDVRNSSLPTAGPSGVTTAVYLGGKGGLVEHCNVAVRHPWPAGSPVPNDRLWTAAAVIVADQSNRVLQSFINIDQVSATCYGISLQGGSLEATENLMFLSGCARGDDSTIAGAGIASVDSTLRSTRNAIRFEGPGSLENIPTVVSGIASLGTGSLTSDGDRLLGPASLRTGSASADLQFFGVLSNGPVVERVVNASIWVRRGTFDIANSAGVRIEKPTTGLVAHNTVFLESRNALVGTQAPVHAFYFGDPASGASALELENNLVFTTTPTLRVVRAACNGRRFTSLRGNRYADMNQPVGGAECEDDAGWAELAPTLDASSNLELECDGGCIDWLSRGTDAVYRRGFELTGDCAQLQVPSSAKVTTDGTGAPRDPVVTSAGALSLACP